MGGRPFLKVIFGLIFLGVLFVGLYFIPWSEVNWGKVAFIPGRTITVSGQATSQEKSQIATFTAGVTVISDDKEAAIAEVNQKTEALIESVKSFGIEDKDIKTQNISVHQDEETFYEEGRQKRRPGQWRVNNSITITLRDVDRASELADLLAKSGATNVYGPNFSLEEGQISDEALLEEAINDAKEKAGIIAASSGGSLGRILSITEGYQAPRLYPAMGEAGGGGAPIEPGSATVSKSVTVVFELK